MSQNISLSTMWAKNRFSDLRTFWQKIQDWGFTHIEANSWLTPEIAGQLFDTPLPVSSVHHPCPNFASQTITSTTPASLSSIHRTQRLEAVTTAKKTIDFAGKLGAKAVILHLGEIPLSYDLQQKLNNLYHNRTHKEERKALVQQLLDERKQRATPFGSAATESLFELSQYSRERGIVLGLETRFYLHEIPDMTEMVQMLCLADNSVVGYWHDVGHAEVQQRLGIADHQEWLTRLGDKIIGIHLHDVRGLQDHLPPGTGELDWQVIARPLPSSIIKVCEIGEWNEEEKVAQSVPFLLSQGIL